METATDREAVAAEDWGGLHEDIADLQAFNADAIRSSDQLGSVLTCMAGHIERLLEFMEDARVI